MADDVKKQNKEAIALWAAVQNTLHAMIHLGFVTTAEAVGFLTRMGIEADKLYKGEKIEVFGHPGEMLELTPSINKTQQDALDHIFSGKLTKDMEEAIAKLAGEDKGGTNLLTISNDTINAGDKMHKKTLH